LHDLAMSSSAWEACAMYDRTGHSRQPGNFKMTGLYNRVLTSGESLITNEPATHPDCAGIPEGHLSIGSFLGVPLKFSGKTIGMLGLANREGGYRQEDMEAAEALVPAIVEVLTRKKSVAELAHQRRTLQRVFDNIPVMLVMWDSQFNNFMLNRYAEEVLGWTSQEASEGDFMSMVYPDPAYREKVATFMRSLAPGWHEWNVIARDGTLVPSDWANVRLDDDNMIGIGMDLRDIKEAQEELAYLASFPELSPNPVMDVDEKGKVEYLNPVAQNLFPDIIEKKGGHPYLAEWESIVNFTGDKPVIVRDVCVWERWYEQTISYLPSTRTYRVYARDITMRKQAEEELEQQRRKLEETVMERTRQLSQQLERLRRAEGNLDLVIDRMPDGVLVIDEDGRIILTNPAAESLLGRKEEELVGAEFGYPVSQYMTEIKIASPDGKLRTIEMRTTPISWKGKPCSLTDLRDITQSKEAEEKVKSLSQRLMEVQEKERRELGHALHDEIGGTITVLKLALSQAKGKQNEEAESALKEVNEIVDELAAEVRYISHSMRPSMLDDYGLLEALQWYVERYRERTGISVIFTHSGAKRRFPAKIETAAYRIIQEALTNAARYSDARIVGVDLSQRRGVLTISVSDEGRGFSPEDVHEGTGLSGMQDMAELAGGLLTVDSSPGEGTYITVKLPVD
jgi:PAS domain S-box-containing protein